MLLVERAPASMRYWWSIVPLCQVLSLILTALTWGRWQAELSRDNLGSHSPYLDKILRTHWMRTLLVNAAALILLFWSVRVL